MIHALFHCLLVVIHFISPWLRCAGDALRIIAAGGVYINGSRVVERQRLISRDEHVLPNNLTLLRIGSSLFGLLPTVDSNALHSQTYTYII